MVTTSWALQVSRHGIRGRSVHRRSCPSSLPCAVDLDDVALLRAKLDILQAIVKELHHNDVMVENNKTPLLGQDSEVQNDEESRVLERRNEYQDVHRQEILSLDRLAQDELVKDNEMIEELRALNTKQRGEILSLRGEIEASETKWQESTAIASAAVEAAERRSTTFATQLKTLERRHKKAQMYCKLQRLVIQGLLKEM